MTFSDIALMTISPTFRCNARCRMCTSWRVPAADIDLTQLEGFLLAYGPIRSVTDITITGGEPTCFPRLEALLKLLKDCLPNLASVVMFSNGLDGNNVMAAMESAMELFGPSAHLGLIVSIDGPAAVHDTIRGVQGAFVRADSTVRDAMSLAKAHRNMTVSVSFTLTKWNIGCVYEIYQRYHSSGIGVRFNLYDDAAAVHRGMSLRGEARLSSKDRIDAEGQIKKILVDLARADQPRAYLEMLVHMLKGGKRRLPCSLLTRGIYLSPLGAVATCWRSKDIPLGSLVSLSSAEAVDPAKSEGIRTGIGRTRCADCASPCMAEFGRLEFARRFAARRT